MNTPLAWKNLTTSYRKCGLAATGVGFAVVLMFMQIGFRNALIESNLQLFSLFDTKFANLTMVSKARYNLSTEQRFPRQLLEQAASVAAVEAVCSVSVERSTAKVMVEGHIPRPIRAIGVQLDNPAFFREQNLFTKLQEADRQHAALVDTRSKSSYGFAEHTDELRQQRIELNQRELAVVEQFSLGTDFANDGTILMSENLQSGYFPWRSESSNPADVVDIGLLHANVKSLRELNRVATAIQQLAPSAIEVKPTRYFQERERSFWANKTPIGKVFLIGTIMGLVVGAIICYQIQFTDISRHMPEFATLKAMGYGAAYFWSLILCQSFYLAGLGFLPGILVSLGLYRLLAESSGLSMTMDGWTIVYVWLLTLSMCMTSGLLAIRKLFSTDPASLF